MKVLIEGIIILFLLFYQNVSVIFSQKVIKGTLFCNNEEIPIGVSVLLSEISHKDNIIGYSISNDKGNFAITYTAKTDSLCIITKSLNFKDTIVIVNNVNQNLQIQLTPQVQNIKEVKVKGLPIISKGDTTTYMVSSFEKESDESIGDVISRMPGFTVNSDGKIQYNGRNIDKYYIEGMDLLGSKYSIANKNLSNKQVSSVEVLHNHEPIKMLRNITHNEGTSLNLKLKNKYTTSYRLKAGAGVPWVKRNLNFSPMLFAPGNQMIASVQSNNTGNELYTQHHPLTVSDNYINNYTNEKTELLDLSPISPSFITNQRRYLDNNSNLISFNYLTKLTDEKQIKTNISFYNDITKENASTKTTYYIDQDTTYLNELQYNKFRDNSIITDFTYTNNAANNYTNNTLRFENYWDNAIGDINDKEQISKAYTPFLSLANELDLYKMLRKHMINIKCYIDYNHAPQYMQYNPGILSSSLNNEIAYNYTQQNFNYDNFESLLNISFLVKKGNWQFSTKMEGKYNYDNISTYIDLDKTPLRQDSLLNDIEWNRLQTEVCERIIYRKTDNFKLQFSLPVNQNSYQLLSKNTTIEEPKNLICFNPELYSYYKFLNYFEARERISYKTTFEDVKNIIPGYVIKDYLSLSSGANILATNKKAGTDFYLGFKNPLSGWLANVNYNFTRIEKDIIHSKISLGGGSFQTSCIKQNNISQNHKLNGEVTYFLSKWNSSLSVNSNYTSNKSQYILNQNLKNTKQQNISYGINVLFNKWSHVNIKYQYNHNYITQQTGLSEYHYKGNDHSLNVYYYINKQHWIMTTYENYSNTSKNSHFNSQFADFTYSYSPEKSKFKLTLEYRNILNTKNIEYYNITDISLIRSQYSIRPREIIVNVTYKF